MRRSSYSMRELLGMSADFVSFVAITLLPRKLEMEENIDVYNPQKWCVNSVNVLAEQFRCKLCINLLDEEPRISLHKNSTKPYL